MILKPVRVGQIEKDVIKYLRMDIKYFCSNQPDSISVAIERTKHLHTRVGYTEGPQVTDPCSPE